MNASTLSLICALSVAIGVTVADAQESPTTQQTVAGHWVSQTCQMAGTGASKSSLILSRNTSTLAVTVYADPECRAKLFTITVGSTYQLVGQSPDAEGAQMARFSSSFRQVTPHAQAIADAMNAAKCGNAVSRVGFATDVLATGCAPVGQSSKQACPVEYDLLKRTGNQLSLGARPADGSGLCSPERQATRLGTALTLD